MKKDEKVCCHHLESIKGGGSLQHEVGGKGFVRTYPPSFGGKKLKLSVRVELFWWRVSKKAIPTNEFLKHRKLTDEELCARGCLNRNAVKHGKTVISIPVLAANVLYSAVNIFNPVIDSWGANLPWEFQTSWHPPLQEWIQINVDDSLLTSFTAGIGGCFRDYKAEDEAAYHHYKECGITVSRIINPAHISYPIMDLFAHTYLCFIMSLAFPFNIEFLREFFANLRINPTFTALTSYVNRRPVEITYQDCHKRKPNLALGHIIAYVLETKYQLQYLIPPNLPTLFYSNSSFSTLHITRLHPGDEEPRGAGEEEAPALAPIPDPIPLHQQSPVDQLIERFDRWETRFDAYVAAQ
ncbi:hypothetical protein MA16_Dca022043 [Dendrobium catenatum]|uniref:Uncharacterized protein n=1 Tax=Dendrobium catenatum TaxID=906689 RepID=A0A2I0WI87_9ASPA|nr:hypothetical protein MA16_Dca022043 [Dendrobium catenatum]